MACFDRERIELRPNSRKSLLRSMAALDPQYHDYDQDPGGGGGGGGGGEYGGESDDDGASTSSSDVDYSDCAYPVHRAAADGSVEALVAMLDHPAASNPIEALDDDGEPALYCACASGEEGAIACLLRRGANPNTATVPEGSTCLGVASANNRVAVARMLLQAGAAATINAVDDERNSALHLAAWNGSKDCVALLLAAGAAPNLKNKDKKTPKMLAAESPNPSCFPLGLPGEF